MKCPHCGNAYRYNPATARLGNDEDGWWSAEFDKCPECERATIKLVQANMEVVQRAVLGGGEAVVSREVIHPRTGGRPPCPTDVPVEIAQDYKEACLTLADSPKASAALSRRCLQAVLRGAAKVKHQKLDGEIDEVLEHRTLPSRLADSLDAVRVIGNFAAHPVKSENTGQIVAVEEHEAEWNLETLEGLFDFYYVQEAKLKARTEAMNEKLKRSGKKPLKTAEDDTP